MPLRPPELKIDSVNPFSEDQLARESLVKSLCDLIKSDKGPVVVSVDGRFGSGKSTFLKMCAAHLRKPEEVSVVEFNAWQQSHTPNSLINLTSALIQNDQHNERLKQLKELAIGIGWGAVSAASQGIINRPDSQQTTADSLSQQWSDIEKKREAFHSELEGFVGDAGGSLVVFLDELDRCMPQQALDYLNVVRHLFDVAGVTVVIGVNQDELAHRVKQLHGEGCDADIYLRRFWDFTMALPEPTLEQLIWFLNQTFQGADVSEQLSAADGNFTGEFFKMLSKHSKMSLRDIQQSVHYIAKVLPMVQGIKSSHESPAMGQARNQLILVFYALRSIHRDTYDKLILEECDLFDAAARLHETLSPYDPYPVALSTQIAAVMLSPNIGGYPYYHDPAFIDQLTKAGIDDPAVAEAIRHRLGEIESTGCPRISVAEIDNLLSLIG